MTGTRTRTFAEQEFDILSRSVPDAAIAPFKEEILALCEAFGRSGQSGGSAPYTASAITDAIKKLLMFLPICPITGEDDEWHPVSHEFGIPTMYQNSRCSSLFRDSEDGKSHYIDAIVWKGEEPHDAFTGRVYIDEKSFELIGSSQYARFPFSPKTFYIDVVRVPITKHEAEERKMHYIEDGFGECYYTVLKDTRQLDDVFGYYDRK